jgi:hypothetical protein
MSEHRQVTKSRSARNMLVAAGVGAVVLIGGALYATSGDKAPSAADTAPTPHIQLYATALQGEVHTPLPTPEVYSHGDNLGGCDLNYGTGRECLPYNFPPSVKDTVAAKCLWLKKQGFPPMVVARTDRQGLAPAGGPVSADGKPWACPAELGTR